jgi:1-acyl-sn-glycerol-3-phosphate acyltransferase
MTGLARFVFQSFVASLRLYRRLFLDMRVTGREHIPCGPKIFVTNHITSTDPYWVLPVFGEPVHVIIGPGYQSTLLAKVLDYLEQINAMPQHRKTVVEEAVKYLQCGESVYTAPEGDIQPLFQLGRFYPGVARIYRRCAVPIVPIALAAPAASLKAWPALDMVVEGRRYRGVFVLRGPYYINVGAPFRPTIRQEVDEETENERIMGELRQRMSNLLDELRTNMGST